MLVKTLFKFKPLKTRREKTFGDAAARYLVIYRYLLWGADTQTNNTWILQLKDLSTLKIRAILSSIYSVSNGYSCLSSKQW